MACSSKISETPRSPTRPASKPSSASARVTQERPGATGSTAQLAPASASVAESLQHASAAHISTVSAPTRTQRCPRTLSCAARWPLRPNQCKRVRRLLSQTLPWQYASSVPALLSAQTSMQHL
eukprot:CAMPEP_0180651388 /NCGR_PEP_ID=MMETSP1037_2-20121125/52836_1 /TAXON_ID=632150 /ORGANISM="Azadinium spinosum, Strain 3D9" /LENGTH=122 /DNA_ID=CAMNT_0022676989 /DNA_START=99 /DNA_END=464 /DNA_ORIENTATION=-